MDALGPALIGYAVNFSKGRRGYVTIGPDRCKCTTFLNGEQATFGTSLPLDRARRLRGHVVDDTVDPANLVHDAPRHPIQHVVRHPEPVRGHEVGRRHGADGEHVFVRPLISHDADALHREEHRKGLRNLAIESRPADLVDHDLVGVLQDLDALGGHFAEDAYRESGTGERRAPDELLLESQLEAEAPDLVLEQLAHRLDELQPHLLGQAADVVMRLDDGGRPLDRNGFDDVGIERALNEEVDVRNALRLFLEDGDELVADALALGLRLLDPGEALIETLARVDGDDVHAEAFAETRNDLHGLVFSQNAVVDEDGGELIADRFGD